jgi:hypothetical protein
LENSAPRPAPKRIAKFEIEEFWNANFALYLSAERDFNVQVTFKTFAAQFPLSQHGKGIVQMEPLKCAVRLSAMLSRHVLREGEANIETITADAMKLAELGRLARKACEQKKSPAKHVKAARAIAKPYGATVVDNRDVAGCVLALQFPEGVYQSGFRNWFYMA